MRRSTRERKAIEFFTAEPSVSTREPRLSAVVSSDEEDSPSEEEEERQTRRPRQEKKMKSAAPPAKRRKKSTSSSAAAVAKSRSKNPIFIAVAGSKPMAPIVDKLVASFSQDNVNAMATLINFLLLSAGSVEDCIGSNVDLEGLDSSELEEVLTGMVGRVKEEERAALSKKKKSIAKGDIAYSYPLSSFERKPNSFRAHFNEFWKVLLTKLLTLQQQLTSKKFNPNSAPMRILLPLVEILMALSNMSSLPSVRDAVTDALLQASVTILEVCVVPLRHQIIASKRQSSAAGVGRQSSGNAKVTAIEALRSKAEQSLEHYNNLVSTIFNTIFVHRYKDHFGIIRSNCAFFLGEIILHDPHQFLDGTYLKYLGWMSHDRSSSVRRSVVKSLVAILTDPRPQETVSVSQQMREFAERYMDRWVEMAVGDTDEDVSFGVMQMMRKFQTFGLIDDLEQEKLDEVDRVIFDASASAKVRSEALQFLMDHTEGFEDEEPDEPPAERGQGKKKGSASRRKSGEEQRVLKHKKRVAVQLETLAEFVEYHLAEEDSTSDDSDLEKTVKDQEESGGGVGFEILMEMNATSDRESNLVLLLVEACLAIPNKSELMIDWETFVSMLLRDTESLTSTVLQDRHVSTLLRLLVCSAGKLHEKKVMLVEDERRKLNMMTSGAKHVEDFEDDDEAEEKVGAKRKKRKGGGDQLISSQDPLDDWRYMVRTVVPALPHLLTRFSDEGAHVDLLLQLLCFCGEDIIGEPGDSEGRVTMSNVSLGEQTLRAVFKSVFIILDASHSHHRIIKIASLLRLWIRSSSDSELQKNLAKSLETFLAGCASRIVSASQRVQGALSLGTTPSAKRRSSGSGVGRGEDDDIVSNDLFELMVALNKFSGIWQFLDCRPYLEMSVDSVVEMVEQASSTLLELATPSQHQSQALNKKVSSSPDLPSVILKCCQSCARCLQSICLWYTRDVFMPARREYVKLQRGENADSQAVDQSSTEQLLAVREALVAMLSEWLSFKTEGMDDFPLLVRRLQCEAFRLIGDLRLQFPLRLRDDYSSLVSALAWEPNNHLMGRMEEMFMREERELARVLESLETEDDQEERKGDEGGITGAKEAKRRQVADQLMWTLLNPLGGIRYDVQNLNRRQAGAILGYLVYDSSDHVQAMVNTWLKKLKEADFAKYLESMLLALKKVFEDLLLGPLREHHSAQSRLENYQPAPQHRRGRLSGHGVDEEEELELEVAQWSSKIESGWRRVGQLSKRFAQTLGVGKCSGEVAGYVVQLLQVAMQYGLQSVHHLSFFRSSLDSFVGHLKAAEVGRVRNRLSAMMHELRVIRYDEDGGAREVLDAILKVYDQQHRSSRKAEDIDLAEEDSECVESFLSFGLKVGWELGTVPDDEEDITSRENIDGGSPVVVSAEELESDKSPVLSQDQSDKGRRRGVGGRKSLSSTRHLRANDDMEVVDEEEGEEGERLVSATVTASRLGDRPLARGLHLESIGGEGSQDVASSSTTQRQVGVLSQASEQSDDLFEEFDMRASRRRYG